MIVRLHGSESLVVNVIATSAAIASNGSFRSWSVTPLASTVNVHDSPPTNAVVGWTTKVDGPPVTVAVLAPLDEQESVYQLAATSTGSLKVTETDALSGTSVAPFAGLELATVGAGSGGTPGCAPSPRKVSFAKPSHSTAGSKALSVVGSPLSISALRRSVLSIVLVRPVPHSVPGSKPTWPIVSSTVAPLRSVTASSPLNQPEAFVWSAWSRIACTDDDWATTYTSPGATEPVRLIVRPAVTAPLKNICTE